MEVVGAIVGSALTEPFRFLFGSICVRIKNVLKIHSNYKDFEKNMEALLELKQLLDDDELQQHHLPRTQVRDWLKRVENLQNEFDSVRSTITTNGNTSGCVCSSLEYRLSNRIVKGLVEVKQLIGDGRAFEDKIVGVNPVPNAVEYIPAPFVEAQPTAKRNMDKIMSLLKRNEKAKKIGVLGMGGVGKTTLVKNVNNELRKDPTNQEFDIVIWVAVSQNATVESIQSKIAARLDLAMNKEESKERAANHLCNKLMGKRFLLILDDIWEGVDLNDVGIPPLEDHDSKVILTTRNFRVCQEMSTHIEFEIDCLSEDEAWKLFSEKVGEEVVNDGQIMLLAKDIVKQCGGLPLALITVGASLMRKTHVALWKRALHALQKSEPTPIHGVEEKVYRPLKWSYDSLRDVQLKSCFLFCCLYPEDFEIDTNRLVHYWLAEGLLDEQQNYEDLENDVKCIVDWLIDSCLLEKTEFMNKVKMHDVVRDVGVWIAKSSKDWCKSIISSGISEVQISQQLLSCSDKVKRVSFMHSKIAILPDRSIQCPETIALFLQGNIGLHEVPTKFLQGFQMLRTLDLSESYIVMLPNSLQLGELRALILRNCQLLRELPPFEALRKLQILDCGYTNIAELPAGFETLANLKILLLDGTYQLREIPTGKICKLHKLEFLDMKDSCIQWGSRDTIEANAPFEDLLCLNQLNVLYIGLKDIPCLTTQHTSWFMRIKKFRFHVDRIAWWGSILENGEVFLRGLHFSGDEMVGLLLLNALCFSIEKCEEVDLMLDSLVRNSASLGPFVNLKKLSIESCCIFGKPLSLGRCDEQMDLLPNLEFLLFEKVSGLESLSSISNYLGLGFTKLKEIEVYCCEDLKNLLVIDGTLQKLDKVKKIRINGCMKLTQVFKNTVMDNIVPNLRILDLTDLPELKGICNANASWKSLHVSVRECNMLKKLPLGMQSAESIQSIWGDQHWWDALEWDSENFKERLQPRFKTYDY